MQTPVRYLQLSLFLLMVVAMALASPARAFQPTAMPVASAENAPPLLQFTAGGHVIGFAPTQVILAAFDHALRVEFVGTAGVTPVAAGADAPSSSDRLTMGRAQPLGVVTYPDVWRGVSVEYRAGDAGILKSTYTVAPGADAAQIRLRYNVPVELQSDGSLRFSFGRGVMIESAPEAWQEIDGHRVPVAVAFELVSGADADASLVTFHVGAYDPRYPLTIDRNYIWHTFYGSSDTDVGRNIAVDGSGNVYITGYSFATWQGDNNTDPLHAHSSGTNYDIVVAKLNSAGAYQWHTFYGSSSDDHGYGIAVDGSGNVYITGESSATWQGDNNTNPLHAHSGSWDIVVAKLNSAGAYLWHTFYGSSGYDLCYSIVIDGSGNVYITGLSNATWWGDNNTAPLHAHNGGDDIVVLKLTGAGAYQWHTFYGATALDYGKGMAVDGSGNVYITGYSANTWQGDNNTNPLHAHSGSTDIVVLKLTSAGAYQWHTFYGASSDDHGYGIAVDGSGNVYITGFSYATWQGDGNANPLHAYSGGIDIVVLKLTGAGAYQWHTFYGSSSNDYADAIAVDGSGGVYITGYSFATWQGDNNVNPLHAHSSGEPSYDIVVLKLTSAGAYQWHTFYGSSSDDFGIKIVVDGSGNVYIVGDGWATWQGDNHTNPLHAYSGGRDIVVLKLSGTPTQWYQLYLPIVSKQAAAAPPAGAIPVGNGPWGIGLDATANRIYVANQESDTVSVIDGATHGVISTIGVGDGPAGVGVNPVTHRIYVANYLSNNVSVIDGATNTVVATVPVGSDPNGVAVNSNTNRIYVANFNNNTVSVIDGALGTVVGFVVVGSQPYFVAVNPTTNRIYVGNSGGNTVSVIDGATHTVIATIAVGSRPYGIGVNPVTNRIYVANSNSDTVSVIDGATNTVINTVAVGDKPYAIDVRTANNRYYVTNENHNTLWVMDGATNAAVSVLPTGSEPDGVAVHPSSGFIYVSNYSSDTVSALLDPNP